MRCAVCGLPLRPSKSAEPTCGSPACRRIHRLRHPETFGRRCAYCAREAAPSQDTCGDPRCRKLRAGSLDGSKLVAERRRAIERLAEEQERDLRDTHGPALPARLLHAPLPANEQTTIPLGDVRRATFKTNVAAAIDRAMDDPDRPVPESPQSPPRRDALIGSACAACRGSCCKYGGDHAYLYPDHFRRLLRDHPGKSREELLADYQSRLPAEVYHDSCIYHTASGCALPRELRSNLCNTFLCGGLAELLEAQEKEPAPVPVLVLCLRDHGADLVRTAVFDGEGRPLLP